MMSRYEAYLNGIALSSVNPDILITDIQYSAAAIKNSAYSVAKRQGSRLHDRKLESLSVTISFMIRTYDTAQRMTICNAIQQWAKDGGILRTNDRPDQRLRCVCDVFPVINSALKWLDVLSITFTAYALPYWEEINPSTLTLGGATGEGTLFVPGCAETFAEAEITANAALTSIALTVGGDTMTLSGLTVASGETIKITYDDSMIQSIKVGATSILDKRTGADDLRVKCGALNAVSYTADASCNVTIRARGVWL